MRLHFYYSTPPTNTCSTKEHGVDIIASRDDNKILIEAKGATSSIKGTNRCGKPFTRNQARTHISVALYTVMSYLSKIGESDKVSVGIALPEERNHKEFMDRIKAVIQKLGIAVFWVREDDCEWKHAALIDLDQDNIPEVC